MLFASVKKSHIELRFPYNKSMVEKVKQAQIGEWDKYGKCWKLSPTLESIEFILNENAIVGNKDLLKLGKLLERLEKKEDEAVIKRGFARALDAEPFPEIQAIKNALICLVKIFVIDSRIRLFKTAPVGSSSLCLVTRGS